MKKFIDDCSSLNINSFQVRMELSPNENKLMELVATRAEQNGIDTPEEILLSPALLTFTTELNLNLVNLGSWLGTMRTENAKTPDKITFMSLFPDRISFSIFDRKEYKPIDFKAAEKSLLSLELMYLNGKWGFGTPKKFPQITEVEEVHATGNLRKLTIECCLISVGKLDIKEISGLTTASKQFEPIARPTEPSDFNFVHEVKPATAGFFYSDPLFDALIEVTPQFKV